MASITPSQRAAFDSMISNSFDSLNPSLAEMYAGTYSPASSTPTPNYQPGMLGRGQPSSVGSPYLTAAEKQLLAQQIAASQALQGQQGQTAVASNSVPLPIPRPTTSSYWSPETAAALSPNATPDDLLAYAKSINSPGNPAVTAAANLGAKKPVTQVTAAMQPRRQGLFDLLFGGKAGGGWQAGSGLAALLSQAQQSPRTLSYAKDGLTPSQSYSKTNQDAIARASAKIGGTGGSSSQSSSGGSSSNLGGVSSSGRRYDYDNNQWV